MKFSICLAAALLTLSFAAQAQTSQTFHFGEGESGLSSDNAHTPQHADNKPKHKAKHRRGHVTHPATYSHN